MGFACPVGSVTTGRDGARLAPWGRLSDTWGTMATDKRERQRANREVRQAKTDKIKRRQKTLAVIKRWAIYGLLAVAAFIALSFIPWI